MANLIQEILVPILDNDVLRRLGDSAILQIDKAERLAFTTDSYVISPIFFPGGDIGRLAVSGTVNDLAMAGARPLALSLGLILEEGFPMEDFIKILESVRDTARETGIAVVTGDTKVVRKGEADNIFINTSGIGVVSPGIDTSGRRVAEGDVVIVSGPLGDHGAAVMIQREGLRMEGTLQSDVAPLWPLVERLLTLGEAVHFLRDPTRGGLASVLHDLTCITGKSVELQDRHIPVRAEVKSVCELLGLDPLYVACEGRFLAVVAHEHSQRALELLRGHPQGSEARIVGRILADPPGVVLLRTAIGGTRLVQLPLGEQLPRIC